MGADEDKDYYSTPRKKQSGVGMRGVGPWTGGGVGVGGGASSKRKSSKSFAPLGDRGNLGNAIARESKGNNGGNGGGGSGSLATILSMMLLVSIMAAGGTAVHYRRATTRMEHELRILQRRIKGRRHLNGGGMDANEEDEDEQERDNVVPLSKEDHRANAARMAAMGGGGIGAAMGGIGAMNINGNNGNNGNNINNNKNLDLLRLTSERTALDSEIEKWEARNSDAKMQIAGAEAQIRYLDRGDISSLGTQVSNLASRAEEERAMGRRYREQFVASHRGAKKEEEGGVGNGNGNGNGGIIVSGIVPGGPGHALMQGREIENMESLDDYEHYIGRREDALWDKVDLLVDKLGREARREAEEWFGHGPHWVELEIEYPRMVEDADDAADWPRVRGVLRIEMAPLDLMPVAVNLFLQQVHHKLWNGCSFVINAMHILQAGPHRFNEGTYDANVPELIGRFEGARLDKMPFQEYHEDYPHTQYTLGYAGRPGGPDFYMNKIDNSINHGPGGQSHHDLHEEADPCFGRVVGGTEIMQELNRIPTDFARGALLLHPIVIMDSRVVAPPREGRGEEKEEKNPEEQQQQQPEQQQQANADTAVQEEEKDNYPECDSWASSGECSSNPGFMLENCPNACRRQAEADRRMAVDSGNGNDGGDESPNGVQNDQGIGQGSVTVPAMGPSPSI